MEGEDEPILPAIGIELSHRSGWDAKAGQESGASRLTFHCTSDVSDASKASQCLLQFAMAMGHLGTSSFASSSKTSAWKERILFQT